MDGEKSEVLKFRVTPEELLAVDEAAYRLKISRSSYLRRLVVDKETVLVDFSGLQEVAGQLGKIGVNINQIAKKLNQGGELEGYEAEELKKGMDTINQIVERIYRDTMQLAKKSTASIDRKE